jgi:hypothetical protein
VGLAQPLPITRTDGVTPSTIELAFDQFLLPSCITRQTFVLTDLSGNALEPSPAYDPVARVVSLTPIKPLTAGQTYRLFIATPQSPRDTNGLRSIGGATLDLSGQQDAACSGGLCITFLAGNGTQPDPLTSHTVDFCTDIFKPILGASCGTNSCHGGALPAEGLVLNSPAGISGTALNRVAEGANTGPVASQPFAAGLIFGINTPIIDQGTGAPVGGNPANSWLVYKLMLAPPSACPAVVASADAGAVGDGGGDAGVGAAVCDPDAGVVAPPTYDVPWLPPSDDARATLKNLVPGYNMPYPPGTALTIGQIEAVSLWIQEGAPVLPCP